MDEVEKLIKLLKEGDRDARMNAAFLLGEKKETKAVPALIRALRDPEGLVAQFAAAALGYIRDHSAKAALIEALKDDFCVVRMRAVEALGEIGDASVVPHLIEGLKNKDDYMVYSSVSNALMKIGKPAVPALIELLSDEVDEVRGSAVGIVEKIIKKCKNIESLEEVERGIDEGAAALRKEHNNKGVLVNAQMKIAKLVREIAKKKDKLAPKKDLLLDDKPKPPKKDKGVYHTARRVRNG